MEKKLLFSITAADCEWSYTKGSGSGGQKRNKTSSAVHCKHRNSGALGYAEDTRSQRTNKELAFKRMAATLTFKRWHQIEVSRKTGELATMELKVKLEMEHNICVEVKDECGRWVKEPIDNGS